MAKKSPKGALSKLEKRIVKSLLKQGRRNQDIQALLNEGRDGTINSARITEVKKNQQQRVAANDEVSLFFAKKNAYDPKTGLNLFDDERLIRAREAMILAVQSFNSAGLKFKSEVFAVLANIAWTYLLHEYFRRKGVRIIKKDGMALLLSEMIERHDCPLSEGVRNNLKAIKDIRDRVEHVLLEGHDARWNEYFQACCVNFDRTICDLFGEKLTLSNDLSFALQFASLDFEQAVRLSKSHLPQQISALDARIVEGLSADQINDTEFKFRVIYTIDASSKGKSHFAFVKPDSSEGKQIHNILVQHKPSDEMYPHRATRVSQEVQKKSGVKFSVSDHTQAWKKYKCRPPSGNAKPENTNRDYCIYHTAHRDYTYSDAWVDFLVNEIVDPGKLQAIKRFGK